MPTGRGSPTIGRWPTSVPRGLPAREQRFILHASHRPQEAQAMSTRRIYALPVEITDWKFDGATEIHFNWEYDDGSAPLLELYEKGKKQQWDASKRLDWSLELNPDNPMELKDEAISIYETDYWRKMTEKERSW